MLLSSVRIQFMDSTEKVFIEVTYALPDEQVLISLDVTQGTTAEQAVKLSGVLDKFPDIDLTKNKLGVFGKVVKVDEVLRDKDRVEIYRPLIADPKESRRKRAEKKDSKKKRDSDRNYRKPESCILYLAIINLG